MGEEGVQAMEGGDSLMWAIWKERNIVVFEDDCFSYTRLKSYFVRFLCSWASLIPDVDYSFVRCIRCIL